MIIIQDNLKCSYAFDERISISNQLNAWSWTISSMSFIS
jgi:hypothetical protein